MNLLDLVQRTPQPIPWNEGEKIPWHEPGFSARMLKEHLTQDHDAASRRAPIIDQHVRWIHDHVLKQQPSAILDLGCGPGFYTSRLAALRHTCTGIDFSPASIDYARSHDNQSQYVQADVRQADYGTGYDLVMMIFGEFNTFRREDARLILQKANAALKPDGQLLLEPDTFVAVQSIGERSGSWRSHTHGLFSDQPHVELKENFWDAEQCIATERYFIIDAATATVTRHAMSIQAYHEDDYRALLVACGFKDVTFYASLAGGAVIKPDLICCLARKPA
jgi:SAM-dependent methyltransferase